MWLECPGFVDWAEGGDGGGDLQATALALNGGLNGLEVGDLVGAGGLEDEVAAVEVGAPGDIVEIPVVEGAEQGGGAPAAVDEMLNR